MNYTTKSYLGKKMIETKTQNEYEFIVPKNVYLNINEINIIQDIIHEFDFRFEFDYDINKGYYICKNKTVMLQYLENMLIDKVHENPKTEYQLNVIKEIIYMIWVLKNYYYKG